MQRRATASAARLLFAAMVALFAVQLMPLRGATAAPLPLHLRWLSSLIPPSAAGPALQDFFQALPKELCGMGPEGLNALPAVIMDEVCFESFLVVEGWAWCVLLDVSLKLYIVSTTSR